MVQMTTREMIEALRVEMMMMAEERGSLLHPDVIRISQKLDVLIGQVQQAHFQAYRAKLMRNKWLIRPLWASFYRYKSRAARLSRYYF
ncbi:hypothetical protein AAC03nite_08040 [Alicyclobacillus acidoterrestris]|nr:hypothetical protein AAC03nite_08040 [Alicyclobacillus acidoterrestris]